VYGDVEIAIVNLISFDFENIWLRPNSTQITQISTNFKLASFISPECNGKPLELKTYFLTGKKSD
jgi:hypothetical protein